jgi:hypothetical protein
MPTTIKKGQRVAWTTSQGETTGTVEAKLTKPTTIKRFRVKASPEKPKLLVRSERTGAKAAHAPTSLRPLGRTAAKTKRRTAR